MECNIGESIKERMESLYKPKPGPVAATSVNKKQLLEFNIPQKMKKGLQRITQFILEKMLKENGKEWYDDEASQALRKEMPNFMNYKNRLTSHDFFDESRNKPIQVLAAALGNECIEGISESNLEMIYNILLFEEYDCSANRILNEFDAQSDHSAGSRMNQEAGRSETKPVRDTAWEYFWFGGDHIETRRLVRFLKKSKAHRDKLNHKQANELPPISSSKLTSNATAVLMTLILYFYDQDSSGKLLAEGTSFATETSKNVKNVIEQLSLYEKIARSCLSCTLLMECPLWYFCNFLVYIRIMIEQAVSYQSLEMNKQFSSECVEKLNVHSSQNNFRYADMKCICWILANLRLLLKVSFSTVLTEVLQVSRLSELEQIEGLKLAAASEMNDLNLAYDRILLESVMANELTEYVYLIIAQRFEMNRFESNVIDISENCGIRLSALKDDMVQFITELFRKASNRKSGAVQDDIKKLVEQHHSSQKKFIENERANLQKKQWKFMELYENMNAAISQTRKTESFRLDLLILYIETKYCPRLASSGNARIQNSVSRFDRLAKCGEKTPQVHFYLNGFQILGSTTLHEIEVMRNEYFLCVITKCLNVMFSNMSDSFRKKLAQKLDEGEPSKVLTPQESQTTPTEVKSSKKPIDTEMFLKVFQEQLEKIKLVEPLVDQNPTPLEFFTNFGRENFKLFTFKNFVTSLLEKIASPQFDDRHERVDEEELFEKRVQLIEENLRWTFKLVMNSLLSTYGIVEKFKTKLKDSLFLLKANLILKFYIDSLFGNSAATPACERLFDFLSEEIFKRNMDVSFKFEYDLKLGYLHNSPVYKNNLRFEFFEFLSPGELETSKIFKKIEKIAFKENNSLFLAFCFFSMQLTLKVMFAHIKRAILKDTDIVLSAAFGRSSEALEKLIANNDECMFVQSEKKNFDNKSIKTLQFYLKQSDKSPLFFFLKVASQQLFNVICNLLQFCKNNKVKLSRFFLESSTRGMEAELNQSFESKDEDAEANLTSLMEKLEKIHSAANLTEICTNYRIQYLQDMESFAYSTLTSEQLAGGEQKKLFPRGKN